MDQRANNIRQDIAATRTSFDSKLSTLETRTPQTFDVKQQVAERPWMALGAAVAAGYVLGNLGGGEREQRWHGQPMIPTDKNQHAYPAEPTQHNVSETLHSGRSSVDSFMAQFDNEIALLKTAAVTTLTNFLHDTIKEYAPAVGQQLEQTTQRRKETATSPGTSRN